MEIEKIDIDKLTTYYDKFWLAKESIFLFFFSIIFTMIIFVPNFLEFLYSLIYQRELSSLDNVILEFFMLIKILRLV